MMRPILSLVSVAAVVVAAACSSSEEAPAPPANEVAANQTAAEVRENRTVTNAADSIRARESHFEDFGRATKGLNVQLKASNPSLPEIQRHATLLRDQAPLLAGWFPSGTGSEAGLKTRAKQEIWSDPEGFRRASQAFIAATQQFQQTAQGGDIAAIRAGFANVQGACKGCHDRYRGPEED